MTLAKAKAKTNETFIAQASLTIITYDHKNMFIVQATEQLHQCGTLEGLPNTFFFGFTKLPKMQETFLALT
jgi:hypothetical protein